MRNLKYTNRAVPLKRIVLPGYDPAKREPPKQAFPHSHHRLSFRAQEAAIKSEYGYRWREDRF